MKKLHVFLPALITLVFSIGAQAQIAPDQARNYQINETHTGSSSSPGLTPPLKQKWSVNFSQSISYPIIADGRVFVTVRNASVYGTKLYALNGADGSTVWSFDLGGQYYWSALCYENGRVFAINGSGLLRAFDGATGSVIWSRQLPGQYSFSSAPSVYQGVIYTGGAGSGGTVYAVSADTGIVLWTKSVANGDNSSPSVTSDGVYVSYSCPNVYKLNPANGAQIWRYTTGCSGGGGKTTVLYNGRLYVRDYNPDYIFDSQTGGIAGSFLSKSAPAFSGNKGFFLNGSKGFGSYGTLEARDVDSNIVAWTFAGDGYLQSSMLVVNDYVYVGSSQGKLYAVEAATGQQVWSTTAGTSIPYVDEHNVSQPLTGFAAGEGILVIPTNNKLVAYVADHPPTITWDAQVPAPNEFGWNNTPVQLSFTAEAHPSGTTFSTPGSPLQFNTEGSNQTQQVTVSDQFGQSAIITSPAVNIDWTAPVTASTLSGTVAPGVTAVYTTPVQVTLTASDSLSGVRTRFYTLDGGATQTYSAPFTISTDGNHTLNYWSIDSAGNSESQNTRSISIDVSAPATEIAVSGNSSNGWYTDSVQVSLTATDATGSVANTFYTVDGGPVQTYANPFTVSGEGNHVISYWSVDAVGNAETHRSLTIKIDSSAPSTQLAVTGTAGNNGWYVGVSVQVVLAASDSRSAVAATYYTVDGGTTKTYTGSFTVSGNAEHQILFWSVDIAGNTEIQQASTVKLDWVKPSTQYAYGSLPASNGYYITPLQITLTASDNLSGVANTYYQIDSGPTQTYSAPFTISEDGNHVVRWWSVDVAGNTEDSFSRNIKVDTTVPVTTATLTGATVTNGWSGTPVTVTLTAVENGSGLVNSYYTLDWGQPITYTGPFTLSTSGVHRVFYWSADLAGNYEPLQFLDIKIDVTAPSTQAAAGGTISNGWYRNPAQVYLTASDADSGVATSYYNIDGGATQTYSGTFNVTGGGSHAVNYWSVDALGNTEPQKSLTVQVDVTAPSTQLSASGTTGTNGWYRSSVQVSLTGTDSEAGVASTYFRVDGGPTQTYTGPFAVNGDGQHQVSFWSVDWLSNSAAPQTAVIKIDQTAPATQNSVSGPAGGNGYFKGAAQVTLTASDNLSGVANKYYRIDGGATQTYAAAFTVSGDGNHAADFWSVDAAGNTGGVSTVTIKIDTTAPLTQATASGTVGTNAWYRSAVQVSLSATDNLSGVATRYYKVDGGATLTYSTPFTVSAAGTHTITFWSTDLATNTETTRSLTFKIDASGPVITASASPSSATKKNQSLSVTVSGKVTDTPSGVLANNTTFSVVDEYGVTQPSGSVTVQANGNYSFNLSLPRTLNNDDSNGHLYTITIQSKDQAGNTSAASTTVTIL
ncbi:MAG: PQQ-binding-like beta-propeller repeat protein [Acidobacteriota bacterium]